MAWGVRGSVDWYAQGLNPPAAVTRAGEEYRAESDDLAAFIRNHVEEGGFTTTGALLDAYIRAAGIRHPPTVDAFGRELRKRKLVPGRSPDGKRRGFRATLTHGEADDFDGAASDT